MQLVKETKTQLDICTFRLNTMKIGKRGTQNFIVINACKSAHSQPSQLRILIGP